MSIHYFNSNVLLKFITIWNPHLTSSWNLKLTTNPRFKSGISNMEIPPVNLNDNVEHYRSSFPTFSLSRNKKLQDKLFCTMRLKLLGSYHKSASCAHRSRPQSSYLCLRVRKCPSYLRPVRGHRDRTKIGWTRWLEYNYLLRHGYFPIGMILLEGLNTSAGKQSLWTSAEGSIDVGWFPRRGWEHLWDGDYLSSHTPRASSGERWLRLRSHMIYTTLTGLMPEAHSLIGGTISRHVHRLVVCMWILKGNPV